MTTSFRALLAALGLAAAGAVQAHGGLSMDQDQCKLTVGRYLMHFAGYQEDAQRTEFCEDIPKAGPTVIVLDFIDQALREVPTEVVIVRSDGGPPERGTVVKHLSPALHRNGTLTLRHTFDEPGDYVGLVYAGANREHQSVFPFSVGRDRSGWYLAAGPAVLVVLGGVGWLVARQRLGRDVEAARAKEAQA